MKHFIFILTLISSNAFAIDKQNKYIIFETNIEQTEDIYFDNKDQPENTIPFFIVTNEIIQYKNTSISQVYFKTNTQGKLIAGMIEGACKFKNPPNQNLKINQKVYSIYYIPLTYKNNKLILDFKELCPNPNGSHPLEELKTVIKQQKRLKEYLKNKSKINNIYI